MSLKRAQFLGTLCQPEVSSRSTPDSACRHTALRGLPRIRARHKKLQIAKPTKNITFKFLTPPETVKTMPRHNHCSHSCLEHPTRTQPNFNSVSCTQMVVGIRSLCGLCTLHGVEAVNLARSRWRFARTFNIQTRLKNPFSQNCGLKLFERAWAQPYFLHLSSAQEVQVY